MKKILLAIMATLLLTGCNDMMNTPTKKVEEFLGKYQTLDSNVIEQLDDVLEESVDFVDGDKDSYKELMKKQYQNLTYKIKEESIDGDHANVEVEIEVLDYHSKLQELEDYMKEHKDEFYEDDKLDNKKYMEKRVEYLKDAKEKVKYTMNFTLEKEDGKWIMDDITEADRQKLHGLYEN